MAIFRRDAKLKLKKAVKNLKNKIGGITYEK